MPTDDTSSAPTANASLDPRVERSRQRIMESARAVLLEEGLPGLTVDAVMSRSGVARATVYRHWESRDALVRATVATFMPTLETPPEDLAFEDRLRSVMRDIAAILLDDDWRRFFPVLIESLRRIGGLENASENVSSAQRQILIKVLESGVADGSLSVPLDLDEAVHLLLGPLMLASLDQRSALGLEFADRVADHFLAAAR